MKDERNWLLREALPTLQNFALSIGAQLQLVDMIWGVPEEMTTDPEVRLVQLEQIRLCRQYSCGPNFAVSTAACSTDGVGEKCLLRQSINQSELNFIIVLNPKGWIATIRYMFALYSTIRCNENATLNVR